MKFPNLRKKIYQFFCQINWNPRTNSLIWAVFSFLCLGLIILWFESSNPLRDFSIKEYIWLTIIFLFSLIVLNRVFGVWDSIRLQKLRNQPSWVYYIFFSLALAPNLATIFFLNFYPINSIATAIATKQNNVWRFLYELVFAKNHYVYGPYIIFNFLFSILFILLLKGTKPTLFSSIEFRFAAGSVGADDDQLGFKDSASHIAKGFLETKTYLSVVALYGGSGFGKSSYARMIIESLKKEEILYTYISLTETNEAKDFSRLFSERWMETLKERYPKIDTILALPAMQSIMRESGNGFMASVASLVPALNMGLIKTTAKVADKFYKKKKNTSREVSKIFANIPDIKEQVWIVMIDEIERAQFDEVYRLTEIIERFKNEGRTGLPVKVLFLLCVSDQDFRKLLDTYRSTDPLAYLVDQFFFGIKSLNLPPISLPPIPQITKFNYIQRQLKVFNDSLSPEFRYDLDVLLNGVFFDTLTRPMQDFIDDEKKSLSRVFGILDAESPRLIAQCIDALTFTFSIYRQRGGVLQKPPVRISDLLVMEYIKIRYSYLMPFFIQTIEFVRDSYNGDDSSHNLTTKGLMTYMQREDRRKAKKGLGDWIAEFSTEDLSGEKNSSIKNRAAELVALVCYWYEEYYDKDSINTENKLEYFGTLSDPNNLWNYLKVIADDATSPYPFYNQIYRKQINGHNTELAKLKISELLGYSRFVVDIQRSPAIVSLGVLTEIKNRIVEGQAEPQPMNIDDTLLDDVAYQITFQVMKITERDTQYSRGDSSIPTEDLKLAFQNLSSILLSPTIPSGIKFIILSSFINDTRGGGSSIHFRLIEAFKRLRKYYDGEIRQLISKIFSEYENRYIKSNESIYDHEENFFYAMYQWWSGDTNNSDEITKIRNIAKYDLEKHEMAIAAYWKRYPFTEGWKNYDDVLENARIFSSDSNLELFIPIKLLISITRKATTNKELLDKATFWEEASKDERFKNIAALKDDQGTLKAILIAKGLL